MSAVDGFTAPANAPGQDVSRACKEALDGWLRQQEALPAWHSVYENLLAERTETKRPRWDWRKALFIAWSCLPNSKRSPKTLAELADMMGLGDTATIRHWRAKDPEIDKRIQELPAQLVTTHVADILDASLLTALNGEEKGFQDRKLLLEIAGVYKSRQVQEVTGGDKPVRFEEETLTDEERAARISALLERARARRGGSAADDD
jgi:hypothetical protein